MKRLRSALSASLLLAAGAASAGELMTVPGPDGALQGEAILVPGATTGIVIIPGSGPIDRNGNSPAGLATDSYRLLAEGLAAAGISTLRIDKRGFFGSEKAVADPQPVTIAGYAADVRLWHDAFARRTGTSCVWIAGHSEGGLVALVAAASGMPACGLILLSSPGRRVSELMREQFRNNPANAPFLLELERILLALEKGEAASPEKISDVLRPLFTPGLQRYMIQLFAYDPAVVAKDVTLPVLILQGDKDIQVGEADARRLLAALPQASYVPLPGVTHMLKVDIPGTPFASYSQKDLPLAPAIVSAITDFIRASPRE
jgi:alpha-beta hydrolase superfamily lysophospholipase